jgi:hypothetical protein
MSEHFNHPWIWLTVGVALGYFLRLPRRPR